MFKRSSNFDKCSHKIVTETRVAGNLKGVELSCPVTEDSDLQLTVRAEELKYPDKLARDVLIGQYNYPNIETAYKHLGRSACALACNSCVFADMSPIDVSITRRNNALDNATLLMYEEDRLAAQVVERDRMKNIAELAEELQSE